MLCYLSLSVPFCGFFFLRLSTHIALQLRATRLGAIAKDQLLLGRLLSSQISRILAFKCRKFTPNFPAPCLKVWKAHQAAADNVLSLSLSLVFFFFFKLYFSNTLTVCKITRDFTGPEKGVMKCSLKVPGTSNKCSQCSASVAPRNKY